MPAALQRLRRPLPLLLFFSLAAFLPATAIARTPGPESTHIPAETPGLADELRLPGVSLAEGITQVTGVAISPLLGVCGVGAWQYFTTSSEQRPLLPWFCDPISWGIGFGILGLGFIKDLFGSAMPAILKKPFDLIELFEDKLSAFVAGTAFLPFLSSQLSQHVAPKAPATAEFSSVLSVAGPALITPALAETPLFMVALILPFSLIAFFAVWLTSHSLNVLLLFSPFSILDLLLKVSRTIVLGIMALLYLISPVVAAFLCGIVIAIALYLAPRSFRLCLFGTVMSVDFLRSLVRNTPGKGKTRAFLARRGSPTLSARTFGTLRRNEDGRIFFTSRFLLFGPARNLELPERQRLSMQKGLLFPSVRVRFDKTENTEVILHLLPRHRHDLEATAAALGIGAIHDHYVGRGLKAISRWAKETFGTKALPSPEESTVIS